MADKLVAKTQLQYFKGKLAQRMTKSTLLKKQAKSFLQTILQMHTRQS